jgi:uncharacterized iron-regulated membrane protein
VSKEKKLGMHSLLILLHRWLGLFTALFLCIAGLTGAVIAWEHELDEWLNPHLFKTQPTAEGASKPLSPLALAEQVETADPQVRVTYLPLAVKPGHTLILFVEPRVNPATGALFTSDYNQVALDPTTGEIQGRRLWGALKFSRENVLPFLYKLHYSLHLPESGEISWGVWLMGLVAIVWVLDTLIAFWIAFPARGSWRKSFAFRWRQGGAKLNFDLHRSGGVWVWGVLLIVAVTAVSMNLEYSVMRPVVSLFSPLTSSPFDNRAADPPLLPVEPRIERERALEIARVEAERRGWIAPPGGLSYLPAYGVYGIGFFTPDDERGTGSLGNPWLYLDGEDGALLAVEVPGEGTFGDIFMQAQFPLHSGRILGLPGRVLISVLGLVVAMLAVTGIVIWAKKRHARMSRRVKQRRRARTEEALTG